MPLCPGSIWLLNFYLPAFVFDIMIRQHLIWSLVLIYFLALIPETNSKEQHAVIRYQPSDFYQGCLTLEFIISFLTTPTHSHSTTYGTFIDLLLTCLQYQFYTIELGTVSGKNQADGLLKTVNTQQEFYLKSMVTLTFYTRSHS